MGEVSIKTAEQWLDSEMAPGLQPYPDGSLGPLPDNLHPNPRLDSFLVDGELEGLQRPRPAAEDAFAAHVSRAGNRPLIANDPAPKRSTMTRQNPSAQRISGGSFTANQPIIDGDLPVTTASATTEEAAALPRHGKPRVRVLDGSRKGLVGGWYPYAQAFRDKHKRRTTRTGAVWVFVASGQSLKCPPAASPPEGSEYVEHLLGEPQLAEGMGADTLRVRRVVRLDETPGGRADITGPLRSDDKKAASRNETKVGRPDGLRPASEIRRGPCNFDLEGPHDFRFGVQIDDGYGLSLCSHLTRELPVNKAEKGEAFYVDFQRLPRGMRFRLWTWIDGVTYRVYSDVRDEEHSFGEPHLKRTNNPYVTGAVLDSASGEPSKDAKNMRFKLAQEALPSEDTTGIEAPDANTPPDGPEPFGSALPEAGTYLVATAPMIGDDEGFLGEHAFVTVDGTQAFSVTPDVGVSEIPNARFSERDGQGRPLDWTIVEGGPAGRWALDDPEPGVLRLYTTGPMAGAVGQPEGSPHAFPDDAIPVDSTLVYSGVGTIRVSTWVEGVAALHLREYGAAGGVIATRSLGAIGGPGVVEIHRRIGTAAFPWTNGVAGARLIAGMAGPAKNLSAHFSGLDLYALPEAPRTVVLSPEADASADDFDVEPAAPGPTGSYFAIGVPKSPPGAVEGEAPELIEGFESGTLGAFSAVAGAPNNSELSVRADAALHGTRGLYVRDDDQDQRAAPAARRVLPALGPGETRASQAVRELRRVLRRPNRGESGWMRLESGANVSGEPLVMAELRASSTGAVRLVAQDAAGRWHSSSAVNLAPVVNNDLLDIEVNASGAGTNNGLATLSVGKNGARRVVVASVGGLDWRGHSPAAYETAVTFKSVPNLAQEHRIDRVVFTTSGAAANPEAPPPAASVAVSPPDRPPVLNPLGRHVAVGGVLRYRDTDLARKSLNGGYLFVEPGTPRRDYPYLGSHTTGVPEKSPEIVVKPGQVYTYPVQMREVLFGESLTDGDASHPFHATLRNPTTGATMDVGSPFGSEAGLIPATQQNAWTGIDRVLKIAVPAEGGFTRLRITHKNVGPGIYVWQEEAVLQGDFSGATPQAQADRDAKRTEAFDAGPHPFSAVLDSKLVGGEVLPGIPDYRPAWDALGVVASLESSAGGILTDVSYRSADESPEEVETPGWSEATADPALVPQRRILEVSGVLSGGARIPPGGVYLTKGYPIGTLCRADGSELPGGAWVGHPDPASFYPETEMGRVGGHVFGAPTSGRIGNLPPFVIAVRLESALREIQETCLFDEELEEPVTWLLKAPHARGSGRQYPIRFASQVLFEVEDAPSGVVDLGNGVASLDRKIYARAEAEAEALEEAPLRRNR